MATHAYLERYRQLSALDQQKNDFIEELLQRVTALESSFQQEKLDHERETRFNREVQVHEMELMDQISVVKKMMDREPFVVLLLDGEGIIFKDEFLQLGEQGGRNAAKQLWKSLQGYVTTILSTITEPKIMTKIYLNVKGLVETYFRGGIALEASTVSEFIRGFNESASFFEIVDVGTGKNKAHDKIKEAFKLYLYNCHCHQLFLGCPSNEEYARSLTELISGANYKGRVSLVEGLPLEKEFDYFREQDYRITQFPDVFRTTKIAPITLTAQIAPNAPSWAAPWKSAIPSRTLLTPSPTQQFQTPAPPSRTSTSTSVSNLGAPLAPVTNKPESSDFQVVRSKPPGASPPKTVERNKFGQRVDRLDFKSIPRDDLNKLKKLKLCNYHFLLGECPNEENCYHDHDRKLTRQDLHILSAIARMTPCRFGLECDDVECIYGHRCPQSEPGKKTCFRGDSCRFEPVAHGIDTNIVKVTKI
ncbi:CCCH zinc finger protein [Penicillium digitatum]|uniref:CCCH zinc finger protein n=1 Tax=Penicillium digitatum TaxID=36651 RepID=A0A7T6XG73_PENDI|nr:CCCH zinc finger protein [Penicillium digitatum]